MEQPLGVQGAIQAGQALPLTNLSDSSVWVPVGSRRSRSSDSNPSDDEGKCLAPGRWAEPLRIALAASGAELTQARPGMGSGSRSV